MTPLAPRRPAATPGTSTAARSKRRAGTRIAALIRRYGPQDVAAALALVAIGHSLGHLPPVWLGPAASVGETAAFYAVVWLRRRRESVRVPLLAEYGPSELSDLAVRPAAMALSAAALPGHPTLALLLGSTVADLLFYGLAALARARAQPLARSEPSR